jgi:hypothetical protein
MASFKEIARKKVAGVPVIYLAGGFVVILGIVAYKMKSTATPPATGDESTTTDNVPTDGASDASGMAGDYSGLSTTGTVIVSPQQTTTEDAVKETNDTWERSAVTYLIESKLATPGDAQSAISHYLSGNDLSFDEGKLRDAAITKLKLPPEPLSGIGTTGQAPAQKQFTNFPGKHTVKGNNDNSPYRLANLYYGTGPNSDPTQVSQGWVEDANHIVEMNTALGPVTTTYPIGTVVNIPQKVTPVYHTTRANYRYFSAIAAANGMSQAQIQALNPSLANPAPIGVRVRVR